ncbi:hypothetical protein HWV62_32291 [Athelia sp. TMB]|nr:hypothetical protein HWV62_32291 [Athelia sp. TMB]
MNGVRRFLGGGGSSTPPLSAPSPVQTVSPLNISGKSQQPPWVDQSPTPPLENSPKNTTAALFLRKQKLPPRPVSPSSDDDLRRPQSNGSTLVSPTRSSPVRKSATSSPGAGPSTPRTPVKSFMSISQSGQLTTRDELLMSLLTSEAVVDSRDFEILSAEETEELKKEQQVLASRLGAMSKKLNLETKIRDAAVSLSKVNAAHKRVSKQTEEQLETANRRVDSAQREVWRISERSSEVSKKLLEHRAGVLGYSVRNLEKRIAPSSVGEESGFSTPNRSTQMSPTPSSVTSASSPSSKARFDGAHLFAGHADALIPQASRGALSPGDIAAMEEKLRSATETLSATTKQQANMAREIAHLRLENEQIQTTMGMELQTAEETILSLERELPKLEGLNSQVEQLRREKQAWERERDTLEGRLEVLEEQSGDANQLHHLLADAQEKARNQVQELKAQWDADKARWAAEKAQWTKSSPTTNEELEKAASALRSLISAHDIPVPSGASLATLIDSVGIHLDGMSSHLLTPDGTKKEAPDASKMAMVLLPVWAQLPSPEARAAKLGGPRTHQARSGSVGMFSPTGSLSDMDVRSLKTMYNPQTHPTTPNSAVFSVEAFAARVQALIQDDRSLIERLLRFAQAHDLLKKNAERAQKLATESNNALETYQKQVRVLEERHMDMTERHASVEDEMQNLQDVVDRISAEKHEIEVHTAAQADQLRQLTEANNSLSARTLALAEEAASAPEKVRRELMAQLSQCQASLKDAQEELDAMRRSEQTQMQALLDELNTMQTENGNLRAQLRAVKK